MRVCPVCEKKFRPAQKRNKTCGARACADEMVKRTKAGLDTSIPELPAVTEKDQHDGDKWTATRVVDERVRNEQDLMRVCGVDPLEWRVADKWECKVYESAMKFGKPGEEKVVQPQMFSVKATFVRNRAAKACSAVIDGLIANLKKKPPKFNIVKHRSKSGIALEIGPYDHHMAGLAWSKETNWADWDLDISQEFWHWSIEKLLSRTISPKIEKTFLVLGNDFQHVDNPKNETFGGTLQDMDTRWDKMVEAAINAASGTIDTIARDVSPVHVIMVDGNHDPTANKWLGRVLEALYARNKHVTFDRAPNKNKIIEWGRNLVMLTHAEKAVAASKWRQLANVLAGEFREEWGRCEYREVHSGHLHHEISLDVLGCVLRRLRTLCPPNQWAAENNYVGSLRGTEGFEWDREEGLINLPRVNVPARARTPLAA